MNNFSRHLMLIIIVLYSVCFYNRVSAKGRPLWYEDYFELKSNQNLADPGKALYLPVNCLERI